MTTWGGKSPRGREMRVCGTAVSKEREEGQVAPLIVGQISGAGPTWLLPGRCGVELTQNPNSPGTHSVDQAVLELRNPPASASQVLGLKAWATTTRHHPAHFFI